VPDGSRQSSRLTVTRGQLQIRHGGRQNDRVPRTDDRRQIPADTMLS
jgi:hypothetical protein